MSSPGNHPKKTRRVSFAVSNSPKHTQPPVPAPHPTPPPKQQSTTATTSLVPLIVPVLGLVHRQATFVLLLGLLHLTALLAYLPTPSLTHPTGSSLTVFFNRVDLQLTLTSPCQVNMSSVGAGLMPDPNAVHYQPPVPDTTNGPFQYTYVPRSDPQYMMANGAAAGGPAWHGYRANPHDGSGFPNAADAGYLYARRSSQFPTWPHASYELRCSAQWSSLRRTGAGQPTPPITPPSVFFPGGGYGGVEMGKTKAEVDAENQYNALHNQMNEPQSIKPADDDISRMYWCRELDGQWVSRSRFSLDRMGNFRWYVTENGIFYAKMLPE
ncbi:hypothetical protein EKO27_g11628 [Xylaria grammica]|uniref:Uncharacterized protein n=1 Tax=Xylaria grammica TaxID=363999 RepID=A0A439CMU5_9PEZI|nr:hypothetical protein EKO27_g11628 [Xylaria grammica]